MPVFRYGGLLNFLARDLVLENGHLHRLRLARLLELDFGFAHLDRRMECRIVGAYGGARAARALGLKKNNK